MKETNRHKGNNSNARNNEANVVRHEEQSIVLIFCSINLVWCLIRKNIFNLVIHNANFTSYNCKEIHNVFFFNSVHKKFPE
jgi:hypothetical protein